jgi:hypothetical protein
MSTRMDWDRAQRQRRQSRNPLRPDAARFKVSPKLGGHPIPCDNCGSTIGFGGWARTTVTGQYVHGYGCPGDVANTPNTAVKTLTCATCSVDIDGVAKINRLGQTVHPHGCPKKDRTT